jgi:MoaA/NifB/PqqE/SkfB family radical SAM enzyme
MKNTFLMMPTMRCNFSGAPGCVYCHFKVQAIKDDVYSWKGYGKIHHIEREVRWFDWLRYLDRFRPYHLEFSGGEPLMYKDFKQLVAHIPDGSTWAITSNTILDTAGISPVNCVAWTASYHGMRKNIFLDGLDNLRRHGFHPSVSIVAEFKKIDQAVIDAMFFHGKGYQVNLLRELNPGVNWEHTKEWHALEAMQKLGFNVVEADIPPKYEFESGFECTAGQNYFCAMPDGSIYPCYSRAMDTVMPLGFIEDFQPLSKAQECRSKCMGCALDHRFRTKKI